jgi:hypothetical protein
MKTPGPIRRFFSSLFSFGRTPPERKRAKARLAAINKGGIPTIPGRVHAIAQDLGLEVRSSEPIEVTVERIRRTLARR